MTDQQTHHDAGGNARLIAYLNRIEGLILRSEVDLPDRVPTVVAVPTVKLLAMIDRLDPDAMRAYIRETLAAIPEADSPEDVDEHPGADFSADDELMGTRTGRLLLIQRVAHLYPSASPSEHLVAADWILGPEPEHVEDLTLSGEDLNR